MFARSHPQLLIGAGEVDELEQRIEMARGFAEQEGMEESTTWPPVVLACSMAAR